MYEEKEKQFKVDFCEKLKNIITYVNEKNGKDESSHRVNNVDAIKVGTSHIKSNCLLFIFVARVTHFNKVLIISEEIKCYVLTFVSEGKKYLA